MHSLNHEAIEEQNGLCSLCFALCGWGERKLGCPNLNPTGLNQCTISQLQRFMAKKNYSESIHLLILPAKLFFIPVLLVMCGSKVSRDEKTEHSLFSFSLFSTNLESLGKTIVCWVSTTGTDRVLLSQQLLAQIDILVFAAMARDWSVKSSINVTWGGNKPVLEGLVTLSVETQH